MKQLFKQSLSHYDLTIWKRNRCQKTHVSQNWGLESKEYPLGMAQVIKFFSLLFFLPLHVCVCFSVYVAHVCRRLQRSEEDGRPSGTRVISGCEHLMWVLGTNPRSSARAASALHFQAVFTPYSSIPLCSSVKLWVSLCGKSKDEN